MEIAKKDNHSDQLLDNLFKLVKDNPRAFSFLTGGVLGAPLGWLTAEKKHSNKDKLIRSIMASAAGAASLYVLYSLYNLKDTVENML